MAQVYTIHKRVHVKWQVQPLWSTPLISNREHATKTLDSVTVFSFSFVQ